MRRAESMTPARAGRRRSDHAGDDDDHTPAMLGDDDELASLRRLMNQLDRIAEHWHVCAGEELQVDLRLAMFLARWPGIWRH